MKTKELGIWISVIAVLIGGLWLLITAINSSPSSSAPLAIKIPDVSDHDFIRGLESAEIGSGSAKVTLVEYADFQCPACGSVYPIVKKLEEDFSQNLRIVYRFFPLTSIHQNALISAQAAYAAGLQGKFWEMHDMIFENQDSWSNNTKARNTFVNYAKKLGLNLNKFESDMDNNLTKKFITDEQNKAISLSINATPTFFVNGKHIQNPAGYEEFKKIIQDEINKK